MLVMTKQAYKGYHSHNYNSCMVPLKCNFTLAQQQFAHLNSMFTILSLQA